MTDLIPKRKRPTPEQEAERERVDERNRQISKGIKPPASGTYGKPPKKGEGS